jgi:hypothetical protein
LNDDFQFLRLKSGGIMVDITTVNTSSPRPFVEVLGLWLKVFKMDEALFDEEGRRVSSAKTFCLIAIIGAMAPGLSRMFHNAMQFQGIGTPAP